MVLTAEEELADEVDSNPQPAIGFWVHLHSCRTHVHVHVHERSVATKMPDSMIDCRLQKLRIRYSSCEGERDCVGFDGCAVSPAFTLRLNPLLDEERYCLVTIAHTWGKDRLEINIHDRAMPRLEGMYLSGHRTHRTLSHLCSTSSLHAFTSLLVHCALHLDIREPPAWFTYEPPSAPADEGTQAPSQIAAVAPCAVLSSGALGLF